jgi:putative transposase
MPARSAQRGSASGGASSKRRDSTPSKTRSTRGRLQLSLPFPATWGGARRGAGRKPSARPSTPHRARPRHRATEPVHVTLRARLAPLRSQHVFPTIRLALLRAARRDTDRFRLLHFSVQRDHVHLLVEASDKRALSSGVRSIAIRIARYVNDLLSRRGSLWGDRWHGRALTSPSQVRNALVYVLANFRKHARSLVRPGIDPYSSGAWFDGWAAWQPGSERPPPFSQRPSWHSIDCAVSAARSWLARTGWRHRGLLRLDESPRA